MGHGSKLQNTERCGAIKGRSKNTTATHRERLSLSGIQISFFDTLRQIAKKPLDKEKFDVLLTTFFHLFYRAVGKSQSTSVKTSTNFAVVYNFYHDLLPFRRNEASPYQ